MTEYQMLEIFFSHLSPQLILLVFLYQSQISNNAFV